MFLPAKSVSFLMLMLVATLGMLLGGCSSVPSDIKLSSPDLTLKDYRTIVVAPATAAPGVVVPDDVLQTVTSRVASNLAKTNTFASVVQQSPAQGTYGTLSVQVTQYEPGS